MQSRRKNKPSPGRAGKKNIIVKYTLGIVGLLCLFVAGYFFQDVALKFYYFVSDREAVKQYIHACGTAGPLVFIGIQILQVVLAPVPGEATGFVGGYLFGAGWSFLYSTIGLGLGSGINFLIGRLAGVTFVRRIVSNENMEKYDRLFKHQGVVILVILFVFPGFPKDILSLLAGLSILPFKIFLPIATFGRMPGTLLLSLQGEFLFNKNYGVLIGSAIACVMLAIICIRYREVIYRWIEKNE